MLAAHAERGHALAEYGKLQKPKRPHFPFYTVLAGFHSPDLPAHATSSAGRGDTAFRFVPNERTVCTLAALSPMSRQICVEKPRRFLT